ncbi:MAG: glycerate kinase [Alphaproteobacteria bacterium]|nr:glycerate kinase [Alphaproteobacteria bacterium]MBT7943154.1 glycerate kinase [Alphaproteobacteria bacterium]
MTQSDPAGALRQLFDAAVAAADPALCVPAHLPDLSSATGRIVVVGAGKASAAMARAVEDAWPGDLTGLVVTRYGCGVPCERIEIVEAAHPVPDANGLQAAGRILELAESLCAGDLMLCLISGGGSALLSLPAEGLSFEDKQAVNAALLRSGATITDMNCVRKHLSAIKGGRLAQAAAPAKVVSLLISDVPGDDPAVIASGPTVADATTTAEARAIMEKFAIDVPPSVTGWLDGDAAETPSPGDAMLKSVETTIVARPQESLEAAAAKALELGITPLILGDAIEGEARDVARDHTELARAVAAGEGPVQAPAILLSGGEVTVTIKGDGGRGGPNTEYLLSMALALGGAENIHAMACDTDGIDGSEDNAGAIIGPDTLARAQDAGLDAQAFLDGNDAYTFFEGLGDLVITGPTLTNVNDFRAILILP